MAEITARDQDILEHIFDTEGGFPGAKQYQLPEELLNGDASIEPELLAKLQKMEAEAIELAETEEPENIKKSISILTETITLCPDYASAYNNRAQANRLAGNTEESLNDLNLAIESGRKTNDIKALKQAYTQRGILRKAALGDDENDDSEASKAALADLELGAKYGHDLAKKLAAAENPYAKLCSAMVKEMLTKLE